MKKVCFGPSDRKRPTKSIEDLRLKVTQFLNANGMPYSTADSFVSVSDNRGIFVTPYCSNSEYTGALALLQLIFSTGEIGYISYPMNKPGFEIKVMAGNTVNDAIEWIDEHTNVVVEH